MSDEITIRVYEVVGSPLCVASDDGQRVFEQIERSLREHRNVAVSFHNVESLTSAFLNAAIGQLYATFTPDQIRAALRVDDMQPDDLALLKRVVDTAKEYFKDPERFKRAAREVLGEDDQ